MPKIFLFNPQNDLALGNGSPTFTAPTAAMQLATSGASLPMWYGNAGDYFLGAVNAAWYDSVSRTFGLGVEPTTRSVNGTSLSPWGWSAQTQRYLADMGFEDDILPTDLEIEEWRTLSSRVTNAPLISHVLRAVPGLINHDAERCEPYVARTVEEALRRISSVGTAIVKLPWSNAGRGQQISDRTTPDELSKRIGGMIKHQGSVEITPYYQRLLDFAMLWDEDGEFMGYSLFTTDTHGGWTGNVLTGDENIESRIVTAAERDIDMGAVRREFDLAVKEMKQRYGFKLPVGIDFIVGRDVENKSVVVPVEINWRRTMGHVSHRLKEHFMAPESEGIFTLQPTQHVKSPFGSVENCVIEENRLVKGLLDLTPKGGTFRFMMQANQNSQN